MRILLLVDCCMPSTKSSAKLVHDLACEYHRLGHRTTILGIVPEQDKAFQTDDAHGYTLATVRSGQVKGASKPVRALREVRLSATIWRHARSFLDANPHDLIITYAPTIFFGPLVTRLKRLWGARSYLVLRDIFPDWAVDAGILRKGAVYRYFSYRARQNYAAADVIGVESPSNLKYFADKPWAARYRLDVLYNWTRIERPDGSSGRFRARLGLDGKVVFVYGGNFGLAQDMDNILRLAKSLADQPEIHFLLVGDGSEAPRLAAAIAAEGLTNVTLHPAIPQDQYLGMIAECDVGLITLDRRLSSHNVPGKLLGYLDAGIPTLASLNPGNDLGPVLVQSGAGLACDNGDDETLRRFALDLARDADLRHRMGQAARRLLQDRFSVGAAASAILAATFGHDGAAPDRTAEKVIA